MGLESSDTFAGLDSSAPLPSDPRRDGDDHIRLIKNCIKKMLPGAGGTGWSTVIQATEQELNYSVGVRSGIQAQIDALTGDVEGSDGVLDAPVGTRMLFHQLSAPSGWVTDVSVNNRGLVVNINNGGGTEGIHDPKKWTHQHGTQGHAITTTEMPRHIHSVWGHDQGVGGRLTWDSGEVFHQVFHPDDTGVNTDNGYTGYDGGGQSHTHGNTLSEEWRPLISYVIIAVKE